MEYNAHQLKPIYLIVIGEHTIPIASFATIAATAALATASPIEQPCSHDKEELLALDFAAFDQTEGSGWRPLYEAGCYVEVAELLREWRTRQDVNPNGIISFHEAQMWAYAGRTEAALELFEKAHRSSGSVYTVAWNLYVDSNIAFLRRDRDGLEGAAAALAAIPKPAGWDSAIGVDGKPATLPWPLNLNVVLAMLRCWDETYEVAAHCHIDGWQRPN